MAFDLPPRLPITHIISKTRLSGGVVRPVYFSKMRRSASFRDSPLAAMSNVRQLDQESPSRTDPSNWLGFHQR